MVLEFPFLFSSVVLFPCFNSITCYACNCSKINKCYASIKVCTLKREIYRRGKWFLYGDSMEGVWRIALSKLMELSCNLLISSTENVWSSSSQTAEHWYNIYQLTVFLLEEICTEFSALISLFCCTALKLDIWTNGPIIHCTGLTNWSSTNGFQQSPTDMHTLNVGNVQYCICNDHHGKVRLSSHIWRL